MSSRCTMRNRHGCQECLARRAGNLSAHVTIHQSAERAACGQDLHYAADEQFRMLEKCANESVDSPRRCWARPSRIRIPIRLIAGVRIARRVDPVARTDSRGEANNADRCDGPPFAPVVRMHQSFRAAVRSFRAVEFASNSDNEHAIETRSLSANKVAIVHFPR